MMICPPLVFPPHYVTEQWRFQGCYKLYCGHVVYDFCFMSNETTLWKSCGLILIETSDTQIVFYSDQ